MHIEDSYVVRSVFSLEFAPRRAAFLIDAGRAGINKFKSPADRNIIVYVILQARGIA